jgi:hypothetical protein
MDIGWKQFSTKLVELIRWPAVFLAVAIILRAPVGRLVDAIALALHN